MELVRVIQDENEHRMGFCEVRLTPTWTILMVILKKKKGSGFYLAIPRVYCSGEWIPAHSPPQEKIQEINEKILQKIYDQIPGPFES